MKARVFNILRQEFGTAGNWQILHPHEWVKKVQPFIREDCNLMGRVHTHGPREERRRDEDRRWQGRERDKGGEEFEDWVEKQMKR